MKTQIIYIPGLGDGYDGLRKLGLSVWGLWGVNTELIPMSWYEKGTLNEKIRLVEAAVQNARNTGRSITLVGESAGASVALLVAGGAHGGLVNKVVTLCGVTQPNTPIAAPLRRRAPAFDQAVNRLANNIIDEKVQRISVKALLDLTVRTPYSVASQAKVYTLPWVGHITAIAAALSIFAPWMVAISKNK